MSSTSRVIRGLSCALIACACWSSLYIHTDFISPYGTADLAVVRFSFSAVIAVGLSFVRGNLKELLSAQACQQWLLASALGFAGFTGYFFFLATAVKYTSEIITVSIIGMISIATMIVNNAIYKEFRWRTILWPIMLGSAGVIIIVFSQVHAGQFSFSGLRSYVGLGSALTALIMWSGYQVLNKRSLSELSGFSTENWTFMTLIGGAAVLPLLIAVLPFSPMCREFQLFSHEPGRATLMLTAWGLFLAVGASLISLYAWNTAQKYLPPALSGQSIVLLLPMVFGLGWHYGRFSSDPGPTVFGIGLLLISVAITVSLQSNRSPFQSVCNLGR